MYNYYRTCYLQYGDRDVGFMPQMIASHTKPTLKKILGVLCRGGARLGGKQGREDVLVERLSITLNLVLHAGREATGKGQEGDQQGKTDGAGSDTSDDIEPPKTMHPHLLLPHAQAPGEPPADAVLWRHQGGGAGPTAYGGTPSIPPKAGSAAQGAGSACHGGV